MLFKKVAVAMVVCLLSSNSFAFKMVDSECNDQAKLGAWTQGIGEKKRIQNIVSEFGSEHQQLVSILDKLPVKLSEALLLEEIGIKPNSVIRVVKEHARFQWDVTREKSSINIIIQYYKGCVDQVSIMRGMNFYNRHNELLTKN